jgi:pre-mRNA-processing factor SLU7
MKKVSLLYYHSSTRDINPHIPQYISAAPWYYNQQGPTLKHQRPQEDFDNKYSKIDQWYKKGVDTSKVATKYRKGACENCGAMTHKKKDCLERPRKLGAKFTNANIAYDEFGLVMIQQIIVKLLKNIKRLKM